MPSTPDKWKQQYLEKKGRGYYKTYKRKPHEFQGHRKSTIASRKWKKLYDQTPRGRFIRYRRGAITRNLEFSLTFEGFMSYWQKPCHYCGSPITTIGLDRIDNTKGYRIDNVIPCCSPCNWMKSDTGYEQFIERCALIVRLHR